MRARARINTPNASSTLVVSCGSPLQQCTQNSSFHSKFTCIVSCLRKRTQSAKGNIN